MPKQKEVLARDLLEIGKRCMALPDLDKRSADEILGYNESYTFSDLKGSLTVAEANDLRRHARRIRR